MKSENIIGKESRARFDSDDKVDAERKSDLDETLFEKWAAMPSFENEGEAEVVMDCSLGCAS